MMIKFVPICDDSSKNTPKTHVTNANNLNRQCRIRASGCDDFSFKMVGIYVDADADESFDALFTSLCCVCACISPCGIVISVSFIELINVSLSLLPVEDDNDDDDGAEIFTSCFIDVFTDVAKDKSL